VDDKLKDVIRKAKSVKEITSAVRRSGMLYMQEQSIKKVAAGITSINEVIRSFSKKP
jgi:type II secretory ATPase GspE/PulE/Tfp pilus assembly ATPase PilB-like protein